MKTYDEVVDFLRGEFIGLKIEIIESRNKDLTGIKGKIVDETKSMFEIETKKYARHSSKREIKKAQKKVCKFKFLKEKLVVDGLIIDFRPEDRIGRKFKDW
ncbi:MAG: ribonuclease P protein subunit [Candidatus Aenigmarchaeota archaeon]|nr:ribonuclease P protein subunit [Candidatus Aenigmarchaeota archaeon]